MPSMQFMQSFAYFIFYFLIMPNGYLMEQILIIIKTNRKQCPRETTISSEKTYEHVKCRCNLAAK